MKIALASAALLLAAASSTVDVQAQTMTPAPAAPAVSPTQTQTSVPGGKGMRLQGFVKRQQSRLLAGDKDGDGRVSSAEFTATRTGGNAARQFARIDSNGDGFVTAVEIEAFATARFRKLDANADGTLAADERPKASAAARQAPDGDDAGEQ